jgi:hypothetical protein
MTAERGVIKVTATVAIATTEAGTGITVDEAPHFGPHDKIECANVTGFSIANRS